MECKICNSLSKESFKTLVLKKYSVQYYQCPICSFIQTEKPYWLNEAYSSAMTALDVGLVYRNIEFANILPSILDIFSGDKDHYLDYGGGFGMFVRIMRDKGYDFYLQDKYAENLFAKHFEFANYKGEKKFASLTAFEVFEHLENPAEEIEKMFQLSDTIIFSTELQPEKPLNNEADWWYFIPETGQHISFYNKKSLSKLEELFNCNLYTNNFNLHILSKEKLAKDPFLFVEQRSFFERGLHWLIRKLVQKKQVKQRTSLLGTDFLLYKKLLGDSKV
jgi:hypothetical protein